MLRVETVETVVLVNAVMVTTHESSARQDSQSWRACGGGGDMRRGDDSSTAAYSGCCRKVDVEMMIHQITVHRLTGLVTGLVTWAGHMGWSHGLVTNIDRYHKSS